MIDPTLSRAADRPGATIRSTPAPSRPAVARALLPALLRAIDWTPFAAVVPIAIAVTTLGAAAPGQAVTRVRIAAVLLAAASAFALIDPMEPSTAALPVSRALRQGLRTLLALLPVVLGWAVVVTVGTMRSDRALPWTGLTLEAAVPACATLAAAATAVHRVPGKPAAGIAIGALLALLAGTLALPAPFLPWPDAEADDWSRIHYVRAALLPLAALALRHANHRPYRPTA